MAKRRGGSVGRITCLGEALIDFLPIEKGGRMVGFRMHPGGSHLNVAVAVARLGQPVALAGKLSTDLFGRYLRAHLEREGVHVGWLAETDAPSTLAFVATESGDPSFAFYGDLAADTLVRREDLPEALFAETAILHVGSISLLRGTTPEAVLAACQRLAGRALLSFDPNLRPALVADEPTYRALLRRLSGLVDIIKVSALDLAWLAPGRDLEATARELLAQGPALVVVTRGADGVLALRRNRRAPPGQTDGAVSTYRLPAHVVKVVDTVGAGDAFTAGLLAWLRERGVTSLAMLDALSSHELTSALSFAAAAAALNCAHAGANPPGSRAVRAFLSATDSAASITRSEAQPKRTAKERP
ncbi:MAG: carbohydrate kinase family protein [Candidatus Limnocylindria bacterium]